MTAAAGPAANRRDSLRFSILGRRFQVRGASTAMTRWLSGNWHFAEHDRHAPASAFTITLEVMQEPPADMVPRGVGARKCDADNAVPSACDTMGAVAPGWRGQDDAWEIGTPTAGVGLVMRKGQACIRVWGWDIVEKRVEVAAALHVAVCEALRASGLMPLHAAVAARNGDIVAFMAASGTGKSTTLVHAIHNGWAPLAEDFAWLDPATFTVFGWDRGIRLWPAGRAMLGLVGDERWCMGDDGKLRLDYAALDAETSGAQPASRHGVLTRVALLVRNPDEPSVWAPLTPRDAVRALWEATGVPLVPSTRAWTACEIARLVSGVEARRLQLGNTQLPLS